MHYAATKWAQLENNHSSFEVDICRVLRGPRDSSSVAILHQELSQEHRNNKRDKLQGEAGPLEAGRWMLAYISAAQQQKHVF